MKFLNLLFLMPIFLFASSVQLFATANGAGELPGPHIATQDMNLVLTVPSSKDVFVKVADGDDKTDFSLRSLNEAVISSARVAEEARKNAEIADEMSAAVANEALVEAKNAMGMAQGANKRAEDAESQAQRANKRAEDAESQAQRANKRAEDAESQASSLLKRLDQMEALMKPSRVVIPTKTNVPKGSCNPSGEIAYNGNILFLCANGIWRKISSDSPPTGTKSDPGFTCKQLYDGGIKRNGNYWLKYSDGGVYQAYCDMTTEGGGWTQFADLSSSAATGWLDRNKISCSAERQTGGAWTISNSAMMSRSSKHVLILESVGRRRYSMYDFSRSAECSNNFVRTVAGDYRPCNPFTYEWRNSRWVQQTGGTCNTNDHSQWNCEPEVGIRFHYGTRNCVNDGGSAPPYNGWNWFTGYVCGKWGPSNSRFVKNWDGQCNKTPHKMFYR